MWLPTLISRIENQSASPCDATPLGAANNSVLQEQEVEGGKSATSADTYVDVFIGTAAQLPANLIAIAIIDRVGGKPMLGKLFFAMFRELNTADSVISPFQTAFICLKCFHNVYIDHRTLSFSTLYVLLVLF